MVNYEEKYLKYKSKYLQLKDSIGSGQTQSKETRDAINKMQDRNKLNYYIKKKREYNKAVEEYNICAESNKKIGYFSRETKKNCILPSDPKDIAYSGNYYEKEAQKINYTEVPHPSDNEIYYKAFF